MPGRYAGGAGREAAIAARGRAGYRSSGGEQLHCASLLGFFVTVTVTVLVIIIRISSFAVLLNCLYLSPPVLLFFPAILPPIPRTGRGVSKRPCGCFSCLLGSTTTL